MSYMQSDFNTPTPTPKGIFYTWHYLALIENIENNDNWAIWCVLCFQVFFHVSRGTFDPVRLRVDGRCLLLTHGWGQPPQTHEVGKRKPFVTHASWGYFFLLKWSEEPQIHDLFFMFLTRTKSGWRTVLDFLWNQGTENSHGLPLWVTVRKHLPSAAAPATCFMCLSRTHANLLSISSLTSSANEYPENHSGRFSQRTPFYMHPLYTTSLSSFPTSTKQSFLNSLRCQGLAKKASERF